MKRAATAPELDLRTLLSRTHYEETLCELSARRAYEDLVVEQYKGEETFILPGFCQACDLPSAMQCDWVNIAYGTTINFRERIHCPRCGLNTRMRFMAYMTRALLDEHSSLYLNEQVTPFARWAQTGLPGEVIYSEYLGHGVAAGTEIDGIRHEDCLALSFPDESFDLIVSQDVFEHVPDVDAALGEAVRVLKPGGRLLFSVPFYDSRDVTVVRAELQHGEVVHLQPPEFHGNPVDPEGGSLVFYEHAWDILDRCRDAGFADAAALGYWSAVYGYLGGALQLVLTATAPTGTAGSDAS